MNWIKRLFFANPTLSVTVAYAVGFVTALALMLSWS